MSTADKPRRWTNVVRAGAAALAALSIVSGIASGEGSAAAILGAAIGVILGNRLALSRLRALALVVGTALFLVATWGFAWVATSWRILPSILGVGLTLHLAAVIHFGATALACTTCLRFLAARKPSVAGLEVVAFAAAIPVAFASHRYGVLARPLWLSDWAWRHDFDPGRVFMGIGIVAILVLAALLLAENKQARGFSSILALVAVAIIAILFLNVVGVTPPQPLSDLQLTKSGEPPPPAPPATASGEPSGSGQSPPGGADGGGSEGGSSSPESSDGGSSEGGKPPPTPPNLLTEDDNTPPPENSSPMAVVLLDDDYDPPAQGYYLRQNAWSQYNGTRLVPASKGDTDGDLLGRFPTERTRVKDQPVLAGRTRVRALVALLVQHKEPFALENPTFLEPTANPSPERFVGAYRFESLAQKIPYKEMLGRVAGNPRWSAETRAHYLTAPADPRYEKLAKGAVAALPEARRTDPFAQALAVKRYLDKELIYSTKQRHAGVADPTADFLFGNRTGYCVHFAHSAVFLWRKLGIPSRIGVGYRPDADARQGGSTILIRGAEAHAWPELYLDGLGWVILDISAERNLDPPTPRTDDELRRQLGEIARKQPPNPADPEELNEKPPQTEKWVAGIVLAAALIVLVILYLIKFWRRIAPAIVGSQTLPRVYYRVALDLLSEAGYAREHGELREDFARRLSSVVPSLEKLTSMNLAARFAAPGGDSSTRQEYSRTAWREGLRALRAELAKSTTTGRRLLGLLHPASFFSSR